MILRTVNSSLGNDLPRRYGEFPLEFASTPICDIDGCDQIPPRSTMPIRGLRDTAPYHWDGIPGDPYGGNNTANINSNLAPNCDAAVPESCTRNLVDGGLASTMCLARSRRH